VYDEACGFCRCVLAALLLWDRRNALSAAPYRQVRGRLGPHGTEERPRSWYLLDEQKANVRAAGAALSPVFACLPGGRPLGWLTQRFPHATNSAYDFVANNRRLLGQMLPRRLIKHADRVIAAHSSP
jgi:predicted DCC family thiol-disulfide oxidoreductase YuxK